ncbi:hypothetical protein EDB83DRAFT_1987642 [Lactarius deliciosus]|nr:hypothetical protein EDB83DRAFT_1987642 [Lactarius deliciosus]
MQCFRNSVVNMSILETLRPGFGLRSQPVFRFARSAVDLMMQAFVNGFGSDSSATFRIGLSYGATSSHATSPVAVQVLLQYFCKSICTSPLSDQDRVSVRAASNWDGGTTRQAYPFFPSTSAPFQLSLHSTLGVWLFVPSKPDRQNPLKNFSYVSSSSFYNGASANLCLFSFVGCTRPRWALWVGGGRHPHIRCRRKSTIHEAAPRVVFGNLLQ